jgi:hypothetical protein
MDGQPQSLLKILFSLFGAGLTYATASRIRKKLRRPSMPLLFKIVLNMVKFLWTYRQLSRRWPRVVPPLRWTWFIATAVYIFRFRRRLSSLKKVLQVL